MTDLGRSWLWSRPRCIECHEKMEGPHVVGCTKTPTPCAEGIPNPISYLSVHPEAMRTPDRDDFHGKDLSEYHCPHCDLNFVGLTERELPPPTKSSRR